MRIGIVSSKGGVGKTTVTVNLAHALTEFGREVIIVDADLHRPNLGAMLGFHSPEKSIHTALSGVHDLKESSYVHPSGIRIVPGNVLEYRHFSAKHHEKFYEMLEQFSETTEAILVDTPPGGSTLHNSIFAGLQAVIGVTTADQQAVHNTMQSLHHAASTGAHVFGIIVNKLNEGVAEMGVKDIEGYTKYKVIGTVPYSSEIMEAHSHKYPVTYTHTHCAASIAFKKLAAEVIGEKYVPDVEAEDHDIVNDLLLRMGFKK